MKGKTVLRKTSAPASSDAGRRGHRAALAAVALGLTAVGFAAHAAAAAACDYAKDRNCLWKKVETCKNDHTACKYVDPRGKFVVIQDSRYSAHYLTVPMNRVTGIEDPQVKSSTFPNYWEIAWQKAELYLGRSKEQMGLAINCASCRDQDQMHIHMACVKKEVREELAAKHGDIQSHWGGTVVLGGHHFTARRITRGDLARTSPFLLLKDIPSAWKHMERQTLAVIGQKDGTFVVLDSYDGAHAEDLLDRDCSNQ